jgi:hypothetical protein
MLMLLLKSAGHDIHIRFCKLYFAGFCGDGAFRGCSALTSLGYTFSGCRSLVSLAGDMFAGCAKVTAVDFLFDKCSALVGLPKNYSATWCP